MSHALTTHLSQFYTQHGFGEQVGARPKTVGVYTGCMLVPLPNIEHRHKYLEYHDLHHLITGYSVGRIGEGAVSAWELGTGSFFNSPVLGTMNLIALSTGVFLDKQKMKQAFISGANSKNLYSEQSRKDVYENRWQDIPSLTKDHLNLTAQTVKAHRWIEYYLYILVSLLIHAILVIPAMITRYTYDVVAEKNIITPLKPKKRKDLY